MLHLLRQLQQQLRRSMAYALSRALQASRAGASTMMVS